MTSGFGPDLCHNFAARRSARGLTRLYDQHLASSGLSASQYSILAVISARESITIADLAEEMVMERTTLMRALGPLEKARLIERRPVEGQRANALALTDAGTARLHLAAPLWEAAQQAFERSVGPNRAAQLRDLILEIGFER
ncbi:DNA-binding MarR family transcriptional regulator [Sphingomonas trueperi]|uniref:MarR family winged helix-turn-helix transcriptional regulator n=1 Tax=Sphingomonas trueperi TaxID=53317 RepID=UPI003398E486